MAVLLAGAAATGPTAVASGGPGGDGGGTAQDLGPSSLSRVLVVERAPATTAAEQLVVGLGGIVKKQLPEQGGFEARLPAGTPARRSGRRPR